jgi:hypothetical protein
MVTMATNSPLVTMNDARAARSAGPIRTAVPLPAARTARRGRMMVTGASALLIGALSVGLATAAQAAHGGGPASPGRDVAKVTVLPGQSLWSVAEAHDPDADTRVIIYEIQQLNSIAGDRLQPGEVLWVPRG